MLKHISVDIIDLEALKGSTKDNEIAELVNALTATVLVLCPDAPQQLREAIRTVVVRHLGNENRYCLNPFGKQ